MKIILISDTHGAHNMLRIPEGDILIHAGDFTGMGKEEEIRSFGGWLAGLTHKHKIVIAGNHDVSFQRTPDSAREWLGDSCNYLLNEGIEVEGLKIWGSPVQPLFSNGVWAFEMNQEGRKELWAKIPSGLDVLITHGPPRGILDKVFTGVPVGCEELNKRVREVKPKVHVFGHIHEEGGKVEDHDGTVFVNAAVVDEKYRLGHPIMAVNI